MRISIYLFILLVVAISCNQKKRKLTFKGCGVVDDNQENKAIVLFDGKSLDAWRGYMLDSLPAEWSVDNGNILFTPGKKSGKSRNSIITKQKFSNFILSLEWKISEGGNSGIFWGVYEAIALNEPFQSGPEVQVLDNKRHSDALVNPNFHQAGALYDLVQPSQEVCRPAEEWNTCEIKVNHKTNYGSIKLNGVLIAEFPVHGEAWETMVANSKFKKWKHFGIHRVGHIGLQDHGDKVWYRNISIKEL